MRTNRVCAKCCQPMRNELETFQLCSFGHTILAICCSYRRKFTLCHVLPPGPEGTLTLILGSFQSNETWSQVLGYFGTFLDCISMHFDSHWVISIISIALQCRKMYNHQFLSLALYIQYTCTCSSLYYQHISCRCLLFLSILVLERVHYSILQ